MKEYVTVGTEPTVVETVIDKSRFIAYAIRVDSVEQATERIAEIKKRYFDATHNCYAYIVGDRAKFSDDGEPQGTAGMPIYECIKNNSLDHVCVVVTRYFGGIKLGAGGLVRAYGGSCASALNACKKVQMTDCTLLQITVEYSLLQLVRKALQSYAREKSVFYGDKVVLLFLFPTVLYNTILDIVTESTLGQALFEVKDRQLCEFE